MSSLSAISSFFCSSSQAKKRCFPSTFAFHTAVQLKEQNEPLNCTSYADFAE
jgi:hypothetical protein